LQRATLPMLYSPPHRNKLTCPDKLAESYIADALFPTITKSKQTK